MPRLVQVAVVAVVVRLDISVPFQGVREEVGDCTEEAAEPAVTEWGLQAQAEWVRKALLLLRIRRSPVHGSF
jgi:hypothetical protein